MGNDNGLSPVIRRYITHDPYALTFFTAPDGNEAHLLIDIRDIHTTSEFLDLRRQLALSITPNGCTTRCVLTTDTKPEKDCQTAEEAELNRNVVLKGPEIARVALRSLNEFPGRGKQGVVHEGDGLNYGYYRRLIPTASRDPIPWRRCRFSDASADGFKEWQERVRYDMSDFNAVCNALGTRLTDDSDPTLLAEGLVVEFDAMTRDIRDPEAAFNNELYQLPLQMRR